MVKEMIRRIKKIDNYRIFQGWKQSCDSEFARVNVIYGQNGSGKSTIADLMLGCAEGDHEASDAGVVLEVNAGSDKISYVTASCDSFWKRVRVFNKEFIRRNLAFDATGGPQPHAILAIGKTAVETKAQLNARRQELGEVQNKIEQAQK